MLQHSTNANARTPATTIPAQAWYSKATTTMAIAATPARSPLLLSAFADAGDDAAALRDATVLAVARALRAPLATAQSLVPRGAGAGEGAGRDVLGEVAVDHSSLLRLRCPAGSVVRRARMPSLRHRRAERLPAGGADERGAASLRPPGGVRAAGTCPGPGRRPRAAACRAAGRHHALGQPVLAVPAEPWALRPRGRGHPRARAALCVSAPAHACTPALTPCGRRDAPAVRRSGFPRACGCAGAIRGRVSDAAPRGPAPSAPSLRSGLPRSLQPAAPAPRWRCRWRAAGHLPTWLARGRCF
jgi:hypothetical protein